MSNFRSLSILLALLLSLLLGATGCGGGDSAPTTAQATTPPTATTGTPTPPTATTGTPTPTFTPAPPPGPLKCTKLTSSAFPLGTYYPIDASGNFFDTSGTSFGPSTYNADGSLNLAGEKGCYSLSQQQITFIDDLKGINPCLPASDQTGVYTWAFAGKILSFTLVKDDCSTRVQFLTTYRWEMQP